MAIACPVNLDTLRLRAEIRSIYARVAEDPSGEFHFHRGPEYAARRLNYDAAELSKLPQTATESFAGVGNPYAIAPLPTGATIVDIDDPHPFRTPVEPGGHMNTVRVRPSGRLG